VYVPLLQHVQNKAAPGPAESELKQKLNAYMANVTMTIGKAKGETLLPYPPQEAFEEEGGLDKTERAHILETYLVQWANQIRVRVLFLAVWPPCF
jgi:hypothetical protein